MGMYENVSKWPIKTYKNVYKRLYDGLSQFFNKVPQKNDETGKKKLKLSSNEASARMQVYRQSFFR